MIIGFRQIQLNGKSQVALANFKCESSNTINAHFKSLWKQFL